MNIQDKYNQFVIEKKLLQKKKRKLKRTIKKLSKKITDYKDTRIVLNEAIKITHQKFKDEIESVITKSVKTIFNRNFECELRYEEKRNEIESKIIIKEDGEELDPKDEMGGSIVDIISFAFRIILWHISSPRSRNTFIFDEPFKNCGKLTELAGMVLKELSTILNFQVILITHDDNLTRFADRIFKIVLKNKKSRIIQRRVLI